MVKDDEARERALAELTKLTAHAPVRVDLRRFLIGTGYDAARAEHERKVAELERRLEQVDAGRVAYAARAEKAEARVRNHELKIASLRNDLEFLDGKRMDAEAALATERERIARVKALADDSLDKRHGPGGCGIYAYSLYEAINATPPAHAECSAAFCEDDSPETCPLHEPTSTLAASPQWRTGKTVGNTIYRNDIFAGSCVSAEIAAELVAATKSNI
jgi:hypothetical protein